MLWTVNSEHIKQSSSNRNTFASNSFIDFRFHIKKKSRPKRQQTRRGRSKRNNETAVDSNGNVTTNETISWGKMGKELRYRERKMEWNKLAKNCKQKFSSVDDGQSFAIEIRTSCSSWFDFASKLSALGFWYPALPKQLKYISEMNWVISCGLRIHYIFMKKHFLFSPISNLYHLQQMKETFFRSNACSPTIIVKRRMKSHSRTWNSIFSCFSSLWSENIVGINAMTALQAHPFGQWMNLQRYHVFNVLSMALLAMGM